MCVFFAVFVFCQRAEKGKFSALGLDGVGIVFEDGLSVDMNFLDSLLFQSLLW